MEMDIVKDAGESTKKCFKCDFYLLESLNVVYNSSNTMLILWNQYQIFVYENLNLKYFAIAFIPEFIVEKLLVTNKNLVCLDCTGNIHTISLKFKSAAQKRQKTGFLPRENGIVTCLQHGPDYVLALKKELDRYYLGLYKFDMNFEIVHKTLLQYKDKYWSLPKNEKGDFLLISYRLLEEDFSAVKHVFNPKENAYKDYSLVILSFDKLTIYACLISDQLMVDETEIVKLYTCPSEICNIQVINVNNSLCLMVGLTMGTLLKFSLLDVIERPYVLHLNTALYKFSWVNNTLIYTDGNTMWQIENPFNSCNINFQQLFVHETKDFVIIGVHVVCTTFMDVIYFFPLDDDTVYLKKTGTNEYSSAQKLYNSSEYLYRIMEEVDRNNELLKQLNKEGNYITALSLSNRQDLMDTVIHSKVIIYDNYEDVTKECKDNISLTQDVKDYIILDSFYFLIQISTTELESRFSEIFSDIFGDVKIHITLSSQGNVLKVTSVKINKKLKNMNILLPLNIEEMLSLTEIKVNIKLISNIPGAYDEKHMIWATLYRKDVILYSEQFIRSINMVANRNICLKEPQESKNKLIYNTISYQHGDLFQFIDISHVKTNKKGHSLYIKLPDDYKVVLKTENYTSKNLRTVKSNYFHSQFASEEFLNSVSNIYFEIGTDKVRIEIMNNISTSLIKITSDNIKIAFHIRNFLANIVYNDYRIYKPGKEFVSHAFYTFVENFQKTLKNCMTKGLPSDEFLLLAEEFQRNIIGALPL